MNSSAEVDINTYYPQWVFVTRLQWLIQEGYAIAMIQSHRCTRRLAIDTRVFTITIEISKRTSAIYEGWAVENGKEFRRIVAGPGDTEEGMKRALVRATYQQCGLTPDPSIELNDWVYQTLNLEGWPVNE